MITMPQDRIARICETDFPFAAALSEQPVAVAVITGVEGVSYRPPGAAMVIRGDGKSFGNLSSGCLERDVIVHAGQAIASGQAQRLRYGQGSTFRDIVLPCGGALEVCIIPRPDRALLQSAQKTLAARRPITLVVSPDGALVTKGEGLVLRIRPQIRFVVFGKGPEGACFARLAQKAGYPVDLHSPDPETLEAAGFGQELIGSSWPDTPTPDAYTAVTAFFHDHDREPALLAAALESPAFFVGAQGSLRAHQTRCRALADLGVDPERIGRLASPFGLIPSTRDPRTLAVSVLAHVLDAARTGLPREGG